MRCGRLFLGTLGSFVGGNKKKLQQHVFVILFWIHDSMFRVKQRHEMR